MPAESSPTKVSLVLQASVMGGVQTAIHALMGSALAADCAMEIVQPDVARRQLRSAQARVFVLEDACAWRGLPQLAAFWLRQGGSKIVIHELHYSEHFVRCRVPSPARFYAMLRLSYALADRVIAISDRQVEWMLAHRLAAPKKIARITLASNLTPLLAMPLRPVVQPPVLAAFGRFHPQKGFDVLLAAMRQLPRGKLRLLIAGGGPDEAALRAQSAGLDDVEFVGPKTDIAGFLAECDAVVIPSRWEPLGLVCQEAKAAGKPVIASRVDGLSEQVDGCGLLVEPENPAALAAVLAQFAETPEATLRAWGAQGRASAAGALDDSVRGWKKLLAELLP